MSGSAVSRDNPYPIPCQGAEMARLLSQDRLLQRVMGGLFPEPFDRSPRRRLPARRVLDVGCGPGGWACEVAFEHPGVEVMGIDLSPEMVEYAQARAKVAGLSNATFREMDVRQPLDFPDGSFDYLHIRLMGFLPSSAWPTLMRECLRTSRPGGIICLGEFESPGQSTSHALERLISLVALALSRSGQSFSPDGSRFGTAPVLGHLLRAAGCCDIQSKAFVLDCSVGAPYYDAERGNARFLYKLIQPFLLSREVTTEAEVDRLYERMLLETLLPDFCLVKLLLFAWGKRPEEY